MSELLPNQRGIFNSDCTLSPIKTPREKTLALISDVAARHGSTLNDVLSRSRLRSITPARFACYKQLHADGMSYRKIGGIMGGRDHSTIAHGVAKSL